MYAHLLLRGRNLLGSAQPLPHEISLSRDSARFVRVGAATHRSYDHHGERRRMYARFQCVVVGIFVAGFAGLV